MYHDFIQKLTLIVLENLENEDFGPDQLVHEMEVSHSTLHRRLKQYTNKNISQFIRDIRLKKASELLLNEDLTISEVAYKVGFGSATYFNKCFNEYFGCSPGEYRRIQQNKGKSEFTKVLKVLAYILPILIVSAIVFNLKKEAPEQPTNLLLFVSPAEFSGNPENEFIADWMDEVLINALSSIPGIIIYDEEIRENYVTNPGNTKKLVENSSDLYTISSVISEENGQILDEWRITKSDGAVIANGQAIIGENTARSAAQQITQDVANEFDIPLSEQTKQWLQNINPINRTAEKFYVQAIRILYGDKIQTNHNLYKTAELLLYRALNADSLFYQAYEELAFIHTNRNYWLNIHNTNFLDSTLYFANKAIEINGKSYKAHLARATYFYHQNEMQKALKELDAATDINQRYVYAYELKGRIYRYIDLAKCIENYHRAVQVSREIEPEMLRILSFHFSEAGFFEASKYYAEMAFELDNDSMLWHINLAGYENANRNHQKGTAHFLKAYAINPQNSNLLLLLGKAYSDAGQYEQSVRYYDEYINFLKQRNALNGLGVVHRPAYAYWQIGKKKEANYYFDLQIQNTLKDLDLKRPFHQFRLIDIAEVYAFRGDKENAYKYLQFIIDQPVCIPFWLYDIVKNDPQFDKLRDESQFIALEKRYSDRYEVEHQKVKNWISDNNIEFN
ncbi:helix-turn-helix domain-containing protein [Draconibacterium orientale]|uniref:helix-turn-helix domain-containing protein n=1 Tax=Draconibacterium orientale TaxID=1168034 RepID=UPI002ABE9AA6|nr:helix-turn-helix domain-containing protein [Draconibacterium orientale]